jgi:hypothetical protein
MNIIVDKSWILGVNRDALIKICDNNNFVLPGVLGYEIFKYCKQEKDLIDDYDKNKKEQAIIILNRLNLVKNKVHLMESIHTLIEYEIKYKKPIESVSDFLYDTSFDADINSLRESKFDENIINMLNFYHKELEGEGAEKFKKLMDGVYNLIPEIKNIEDPNSTIFDETLNKIYNDRDYLIKIYDIFRFKYMPKSKIIDFNWAILCWFQVFLIYAVEYKRDNDSFNRIISPTKLIHDHIDVEYLTLGVFNKCLASNDTKMIKIFHRCCKDGVLFKIDGQSINSQLIATEI